MTYLLGVGTTYFVALYGSYIFAELARHRASPQSTDECESYIQFDEDCYSLFISQSGETYDTRMALESAKNSGSGTGAIVNVVGSTISRIADDCILQGSGPEISVVSTKSALSQMIILHRIALQLALQKNIIDKVEYAKALDTLGSLSDVLGKILNEMSGLLRDMAYKYLQPPGSLP